MIRQSQCFLFMTASQHGDPRTQKSCPERRTLLQSDLLPHRLELVRTKVAFSQALVRQSSILVPSLGLLVPQRVEARGRWQRAGAPGGRCLVERTHLQGLVQAERALCLPALHLEGLTPVSTEAHAHALHAQLRVEGADITLPRLDPEHDALAAGLSVHV
eukprot:CAMPEP_0183395754 /NCGR_PEP_ID=MMETSP0370-20130417/9551_1 /TAXON_ID=268820 /ORGANISM="Peridinium aciculiferum, Strain PAER-2" /LENGTH=159 /DNA_ID=CAMNT_0025576435 /DNA_START=20 /DNA_END=499 /DNA_ORIENTATION=+